MKIGIFGDSFSDPSWNTNSYESWVELLSKDYDIVNFSANGSSLWFSYNNLKKNFQKF